jgi:large conductance mechanosensitive channel
MWGPFEGRVGLGTVRRGWGHRAEAEDGVVSDVFKEFKDFISRGNVVDLAVAVIIGLAFIAIVTAIVSGLITPLIGMIFSTDFREMTFTVNESVFSYGIVIDATIRFLLVAAVVFFLVVKPLNMLAERRRRGEEPVDETELSDEAVLLAEIRDLLRAQAGRGGAGASQPPTL